MGQDLDKIIEQSINLYQAEFHPKREYMTFLQCGFLIVLFAGFLAAFGWYQQQGVHLLDDKLTQLGQQEAQLSSQIVEISMAQRKKLGDGIHDEEIQLKESDLNARKALLESLVGDVRATTQGFSEYLAGLSRQHVAGSWITEFSIKHGGADIAISGNVLSAELAPEYLIKLADETLFRGKQFDVLEVSRRELQVDGNTLLAEDMRFLIRTQSASSEESDQSGGQVLTGSFDGS